MEQKTTVLLNFMRNYPFALLMLSLVYRLAFYSEYHDGKYENNYKYIFLNYYNGK